MFDPQAHLIRLPRRVLDTHTGAYHTVLEDYLEVKWLLVWFRERYPRGTILTEELCVDLDRECTKAGRQGKPHTARGYARFRATVATGEGATATGTGTETAANFPDFVEKAETRAIGRALAALGIGTQFVGEELSEGEHLCDAPVSPPRQAFPAPDPDGPRHAPPAVPRKAGKSDHISTRQATLIAAIARELFLQTADGETRWKPGAKAHCERAFGTIKWREVKALPFERLQAGYVELRTILDGRRASTEPVHVPSEELAAPLAAGTNHGPAVASGETPASWMEEDDR